MLYDEENQVYCRYRNGEAFGDVSGPCSYYPWQLQIDHHSPRFPILLLLTFLVPTSWSTILLEPQWRAPEEILYNDMFLDEKIDVFSLGNNFVSGNTAAWFLPSSRFVVPEVMTLLMPSLYHPLSHTIFAFLILALLLWCSIRC
jgi:hypothetical protein